MRRLLFRWSLRSALVAVAIAGCVLGYAAKVRRYRAEQERAIAEIDRLGGYIGARLGYCIVNPDARPVRTLMWGGDELVDSDLDHLAWLPDLDTLYPRRVEGHRRRPRPAPGGSACSRTWTWPRRRSPTPAWSPSSG